ncbi:recombinase family protein [Halorubrum sp. GN11GM_10-3_MGM]|uniref:recombinase family protein n=1 Tax=Halorubrum sp. GN11GM_10-3_MGM TaxID=2518111 RepID=UPI0010F4B534|nr:recombinase family protein [Halorubrum sp. GN11GM_10-3_MGM]TKX72175.1 recombinase family protein [Halorubrum sp. GN11GM_10-3_MGM]
MNNENTTALLWVRQSQGTDDSISLELQREGAEDLANDLNVDEIDWCDLGVHTGFSINSTEKSVHDEHRLDANPKVQDAITNLEAGDYDYLITYDSTRLSRDGYREHIKTACAMGSTELVFVDGTDDEFARDIRHRVEQEAKQAEIRKSRKAVERRQANGKWQGGAPTGFEFVGGELQPDSDFSDVLQIIELKDGGESHRDAIEQVGIDVSPATVSNILNRREMYENYGKAEKRTEAA